MCFCLFIFRYNLLDRLQFLFFVCLFLIMFFLMFLVSFIIVVCLLLFQLFVRIVCTVIFFDRKSSQFNVVLETTLY